MSILASLFWKILFIFCRYTSAQATNFYSQGDIADTCSYYIRNLLNPEIQASYQSVSRDRQTPLSRAGRDDRCVSAAAAATSNLQMTPHTDAFPYIVAFPSTEALYRPAMTILFLKQAYLKVPSLFFLLYYGCVCQLFNKREMMMMSKHVSFLIAFKRSITTCRLHAMAGVARSLSQNNGNSFSLVSFIVVCNIKTVGYNQSKTRVTAKIFCEDFVPNFFRFQQHLWHSEGGSCLFDGSRKMYERQTITQAYMLQEQYLLFTSS